MLAGALGLAPFKDTFWTSSVEPGAPYPPYNVTEPAPVLEALVSTLSTGPVGASDRIGCVRA